MSETVNKEDIKKWCTALRSGKYKQTKGSLQDSEGYCCLGVAVDLFVPDYPKGSTGYLQGALPSFAAPEWLQKISSEVEEKEDYSLTYMNDKQGRTFNEIADVLEELYLSKNPSSKLKGVLYFLLAFTAVLVLIFLSSFAPLEF